MTPIFGNLYAKEYDFFYQDKEYGAECNLLEKIFNQYSERKISSILDLGCGTGTHALELARRGYSVTGIDYSGDMLMQARTKLDEHSLGSKATFLQGDIRHVEPQKQFDVVIMLFAVLSYQIQNDDILATLQTARKHLGSHGLLIFDVWYGPAVLHQKPEQRAKVIPTKDGEIIRLSSGELDVNRQICQVNYQIWHLEKECVVAKGDETHQVRYFFPRELDLFLECSNFNPLSRKVFPDFNRDPDENSWNVIQIARVKE